MSDSEEDRHVLAVGDFFSESWGYDQTNVNFYEVVKVSASQKSVWIREVQTVCMDEDRNITHVAPLPGTFVPQSWRIGDEPVRKAVRWYRSEPVLTMTSYSIATLWHGERRYETAGGWGH